MNHSRGVRLDAAILSLYPSTTRALVKRALGEGQIQLRESAAAPLRTVAKGYKLRGGETIVVHELLETTDNLVLPEPHPLALAPVYEDDDLLAFDKPQGISVQPLNCRERGTLMNSVVARYPECRTLGAELVPLGENPLMAGALHRIDTGTSGLVLVARNRDAYVNVRAQFAAQAVKKTYLALVEGFTDAPATLTNELVHDPTVPFCKMIDAYRDRHSPGPGIARPLHAVTTYRPLGHTKVENEDRTLLEVTIFTGVTHQIRAQLAIAGLHIVNDRLYGAFAIEHQIGHCLHAYAVAFQHPTSGQTVRLQTAVPSWATVSSFCRRSQ